MKAIVFIIAMFIGLSIGGMMASWIFFGLITLAGFIGLVESDGPLKWLVYKTSGLFDIIIFVLSIIATIKMGVTVTASLTIAGLGFTFLYRPYIVYQINNSKKK